MNSARWCVALSKPAVSHHWCGVCRMKRTLPQSFESGRNPNDFLKPRAGYQFTPSSFKPAPSAPAASASASKAQAQSRASLTDEQGAIVDAVLGGRSVFITGKAGTGTASQLLVLCMLRTCTVTALLNCKSSCDMS